MALPMARGAVRVDSGDVLISSPPSAAMKLLDRMEKSDPAGHLASALAPPPVAAPSHLPSMSEQLGFDLSGVDATLLASSPERTRSDESSPLARSPVPTVAVVPISGTTSPVPSTSLDDPFGATPRRKVLKPLTYAGGFQLAATEDDHVLGEPTEPDESYAPRVLRNKAFARITATGGNGSLGRQSLSGLTGSAMRAAVDEQAAPYVPLLDEADRELARQLKLELAETARSNTVNYSDPFPYLPIDDVVEDMLLSRQQDSASEFDQCYKCASLLTHQHGKRDPDTGLVNAVDAYMMVLEDALNGKLVVDSGANIQAERSTEGEALRPRAKRRASLGGVAAKTVARKMSEELSSTDPLVRKLSVALQPAPKGGSLGVQEVPLARRNTPSPRRVRKTPSPRQDSGEYALPKI
jgi:hypothetical protein